MVSRKINVLTDSERAELAELSRQVRETRQAANQAAELRRERAAYYLARGATYREVAEAMGITRGALQTIIGRSRR